MLFFALSLAINLVPERPSTAPDYFCTWNIQGYACNYAGVAATRREINQSNLFGTPGTGGWLNFYPQARKDLIFVMDDSWDVPPSGDERQLGRLELDHEKFPGFSGASEIRLRKLSDSVRLQGWKGLGGWVCAQECPALPALPEDEYWRQRLRQVSALSYLKVDWGKHADDVRWRKQLMELKRTSCPETTIEAAINPAALAFADTYRTYDVEVILSAPTTLARIAALLGRKEALHSPSLINCEDEVYIGAGLGCCYGVMRHPIAGPLPDGRPDFVFPSSCRDLKRRMDEVTRAVRWHRIAPPFPAGVGLFRQSSDRLADHWTFAAGESWMSHPVGAVLTATAPAILARGLDLPTVRASGVKPFVVAARYPNGSVSVATIGRAQGRTYTTPRAEVGVTGATLGKPVGVFGHYAELSLLFRQGRPKRVWMQDLAGTGAVDVTSRVTIRGRLVTLPGPLIDELGTSAGHAGDLSDPGLVLVARS